MPLFPAYASKDTSEISDNVDELQDTTWEATESREAQLLASDSEEERPSRAAPPAAPPPPAPAADFYLDSRLDPGNLRVSTIYYPGRPQYERCAHRIALVGGGAAVRRGPAGRRYWARRAIDAPDAAAAAERDAAYRQLLRDRSADVALWLQYIDFEEACVGAEAALAAAERATERVPRAPALRTRLLAAARAALPRDSLLRRLRDLLATEKCGRRRAELWEALVEAAGGAGAAAARAAAAAAVADARAYPPAYPRLLHAYGVFLRTGGLWEELVLLVELVMGMAGVPAPPPPTAALAADIEARLVATEERALASGLPLAAVWVRVERARAAAHWRPAPLAPAALEADPQRTPLAHDLAELLQPLVGERHRLLLCVTLLRLAKVPLLPGSGYAARAWGVPATDCAEALLPLLRAARRLPPAHPASAPPRLARALLAALLDPPHYFTDDNGYLSWVVALWDACCGWVAGERRAALLCWRLRWLHALLLLLDTADDDSRREVGRIRDQARTSLKRFADGAPLAFAEFARIERVASGRERATRAAEGALCAALQDGAAPRVHALHIARIVCEVSGEGGEASAAGARALVSAVLGRAPLPAAPTADELNAALQICEQRCEELERRFALEAEDGDAGAEDGEDGAGEAGACLAALLPGEAEWGAARALLAAPTRRDRLLCALPAQASAATSAAAERYYEQSACALVAAAAPPARAAAARALARTFPHNAYLALAGAGAPLWAWRGVAERAGALAPPRTSQAALAALLPALLRAHAADWAPQEAEACARAARRATAGAAGGAGALLGALRLEAEGRAPRPRLLPALYEALDRTPHAKWVMMRGAGWCGGEAGALHDALLHAQLRTHALLDELAALAPPAPAAPATAASAGQADATAATASHAGPR